MFRQQCPLLLTRPIEKQAEAELDSKSGIMSGILSVALLVEF